MVTVVVFEDNSYRNLLPLTYTKPIYELLCGGRRQRERLEEAFGADNLILLVREYLADMMGERFKGGVNEVDGGGLLINGGALLGLEDLRSLEKKLKTGEGLYQEGQLLALRAGKILFERIAERAIRGGRRILELANRYAALKPVERVRMLRYPWHLIQYQSEMILLDVKERRGELGSEHPSDRGKEPVLYGETSTMEKGCFTDTRHGPIIIEEDVDIHYGSRISGPTWIRRGSQIFSARLREGTSIGEICKVGGEVEHSIIEAYSNKAHESFLGHSYVGEWVNLGAQSVTSNLKNTYGTVKMDIGGERVDSDRIKLGVFFADHSKVSIATAIYAGKRIGVASQVHGVVTDDVPSFTFWAVSLGRQPYEILLESAVETQKRMFSRRGVEQKRCDRDLLTYIYEVTMEERMKRGVKRGIIPPSN